MTQLERIKTVKRAKLEAKAKHICSADNYYDLCNSIDEMTDAQLRGVIKCNGDYDAEWREFERYM